ncbi:MAG: 50S ribosomal protein L25 [Bacteroidales bacterium]|nr:50S ribosomal protein L25 [Bacteroidales bacterium]MBR4218982.1 50S ribosomal protein L25 [Bacteroidales bacterium]
MKSVSMSGSLRENVGKKDAKAQRAQGLIPCVIYGGEKQYQFVVPENQFRNIIYTPEVKYAELTLGDKTFTAIIQATQFHPITDRLLHVDFLEVVEGKPITIELPLLITGTSPGVLRGGKMVKKARKIKVKGELANIPENITIDISNMEINDNFKVGDIKVDNLTIMDNPNKILVSVLVTRNVEATTEEAAAEE